MAATLGLRPPLGRLSRRAWLIGLATALAGGSLLWPRPARAVSIAEDWNCADSASLTCDLTWTEIEGSNWQILTNRANMSLPSGAVQSARADSDLATDDHYAQATLVSWTGTAGGIYGAVFCRKDSTATVTYYVFRAQTNFTPEHDMYKYVSGTATQLGSTDATDPVAGEVIRVEADGSTITGKINGATSVGPVTDTAITGNLRTGIYGYMDGAGDTINLDDFSAADLAAAGCTPRRMLLGVGC